MDFSDILKGASTAVSFIPGVGGIANGIINGLSSLFGSSSAKKQEQQALNAQMAIAKAQIAAQQEANAKNIAFQREANQMNIDATAAINASQLQFQREINDLMRYDSKHAISDKRADLARAGYSAADPSLNGFSAASLGAPSQSVPTIGAAHVDPSFSPAAAQSATSLYGSMMSSHAQLQSTLSQIDLNRATHMKTVTERDKVKQDTLFDKAKFDTVVSQMKADVDNTIANTNLSEAQKNNLVIEANNIATQSDLLAQDLISKKFENSKAKERYSREYQMWLQQFASIKFDNDIKFVEKELKEMERDLARLGINFNSNDYISTILRVASSPDGRKLLPNVMNFIVDAFKELFSAIF